MLSIQLEEALSDGHTVEMDDDKLIAAATAVVRDDPKNRFGAISVRRRIAKDLGQTWVNLVNPDGSTYSEVKAIERLTGGKDAAFIRDRARGYFKLKKVTAKGAGLSFQKTSRDDTEVLYNGDVVGEITRQLGLVRGSTRENEWTYDVIMDPIGLKELGIDTNNRVPSVTGLRGLNDAKKWVANYFKRSL